MKKTILLVLVASAFIVTAQAQPFKQVGGENNFQLSFAPWGNSPVSLQNGVISFRKFNATGTAAWRIGFSVGSGKSTNVLEQASDSLSWPTSQNHGFFTTTTGLNPQADERVSSFSVTLRPGYEKHFTGTDRLSPYIGGEVVFTMASTKTETDNVTEGNYTVTYPVFGPAPTVAAPWTINVTNSKGGYTTFGLNLIAGFDFYFAKNVSLGAELNFGYYHTGYKDLESEYVKNTTTTSDPTPQGNVTETSTNAVTSLPKQKQGSSSGFGPDVMGLIKLGWLF